MDASNEEDRGICILCLDNGGAGTYSQLSILRQYMVRLAMDLNADECDVYPAEYFELMGGVGFGGLICFMLGHLQMNVEEASEALVAIALAVFPQDARESDADTNMKNLKAAIEDMLQRRQIPVDTKLNDKRVPSGKCKVVIYAANSVNMIYPVAFRNYPAHGSTLNPTIVDALCATMAIPPLFPPVKIGPRLREQSFAGGPVGANNPTRELLKEACNIFGNEKRVAQILSVGSGRSHLLSRDRPVVAGGVEYLASDCDMVASELLARLFGVVGYLRLNVDKSMEDLTMEDWSGIGAIESHTNIYMETAAVAKLLDTSLDRLKRRIGTATLGQINYSSGIKVRAKKAPTVSPYYVTREKAWEDMLLHLDESSAIGQKIFAITGMGGCGKTQMVSYFLQEKDAQFTHTVFVDASSAASIKADLQEWTRSLGEGHVQDVWEDALSVLASGSQIGQWILILDNADDPALKLAPFFPNCDHGTIVITSRNRDVGNLAKTYHLELGEMERSEALSTLLRAARRQQPLPTDELKSANILLGELGCLALGLVHAGTYCYQLSSTVQGVFHPYTFTQYLGLFNTGRAALMKRAGPSALDGYERGVYTTLDLSYCAIPPIGKEFLHFASQFHHSDIPFSVLEIAAKNNFKDPDQYLPRPEQHSDTVTALYKLLHLDDTWSELHVQDIVQKLRSFSLISTTIVADSLFIQLHPLVQAWSRDTVLSGSQNYQAMARQVLTSCCLDNHVTLHRYLLPHIDEVLNGDRGLSLHINDRIATGRVLHKQGHHQRAEGLFRSAHMSMMEGLPEETPDTLAITSWLAQTIHSKGRWDEAEKLQVEILEQYRRILGKEHLHTIEAANNLAVTYSEQGREAEAEKLKLEVLEQRGRILGRDHPDTIRAANNLAATYHKRGRLDEAEKLQVEVLEQRGRILGKEHPDTIRAASNLADTYRARGRLDEAEKLQAEVLEQRGRILGKEHPSTTEAANNLAVTYSEQGREVEAEKLKLEVFEQLRRVLGTEHPHTIGAANNLATTYHKQGRLDEAEKLTLEVLEQYRRTLGRQHPDTILAASNLAIQYMNQSKWVDAELLLGPAVQCSVKLLGVAHPSTQRRVQWLAHVYKELGKQNEAKEMEKLLLIT